MCTSSKSIARLLRYYGAFFFSLLSGLNARHKWWVFIPLSRPYKENSHSPVFSYFLISGVEKELSALTQLTSQVPVPGYLLVPRYWYLLKITEGAV